MSEHAVNMRVRTVASVASVPTALWNELELGGNPFLRHEFLVTLERTGCVGAATGWSPEHLIVESDNQLLGALPLYRKTHSWGEFVFDWSWARAYNEAGLPYYPKLVSMAPFSPVPGLRFLVRKDADLTAVKHQLLSALLERCTAEGCSSAHVLFPLEADLELLKSEGFLQRQDCQFHWHNRNYRSFEDFIGTFRADKRKKALRERRRIREAGVAFETLHGGDMDESLWRTVFAFSENTFQVRGHEHYLSADFFIELAAALPSSIMVKLARFEGRPIAAAIFMRSDHTLYGRYWGSLADFHSLHFEACYYQGIEYCIEQGLQTFEPGTQGEHKVPRGFEPVHTWSAHWIKDPRFRRAIANYLAQERTAVDQYMESVREHAPFRRDLKSDGVAQ